MEKDFESHGCSKSTSNHQNQEESLISSIQEYKIQLDEVSTALESANGENKTQLEELQLNLITILELTLSQLDHCQKNAEPPTETPSPNDNNKEEHSSCDIDEEFKRFQSEIASLDEDNDKEGDSLEEEEDEREFSAKMKELESSLKLLEGQNVRASYKEQWGGYSYHNAVVLSLVPHENSTVNYDNPEVLVLFSQPTSVAMVPCRFFLDGRCKFEDGGCRFSHGYRVAVKDLMEYKDHDRNELVSGSRVLALHDGNDIWHRGMIEDVLEGRTGFSFNCSHCVQVVEVDLEAMVPLFADEDAEGRSCSRKTEGMMPLPQSSSLDDDAEENVFVPTDAWLSNPLSTRMGDWEKHTKGIGSKLMAKMGYVIGTGLGPLGEGRVDPVTAYIYPRGVSIDHCMRLREASNGGCILDVEKRLLNEQKKAEEKRKRQESNLKANRAASVFDIINSRLNDKSAPLDAGLRSTSQQGSGEGRTVNVSRPVLKKDSAKELRRKNLALGSRIDRLKSEVANLKKSRVRHTKDTATLKLIDSKVEARLKELSALQAAEEQVELEQQSRKDVQKLFSF